MFFGVAFDEFRVDVGADEGDGLFFEVLRLLDASGAALLGDFCRGFRRCRDAPHFGEGVHVEREVVEFAVIVGDGGVDVVVEGDELIDVVPDFAV